MLRSLAIAPASVPGKSYDSTILADSPVGFWPLNETSGTTANDTTGNGHNGTYTGTSGTNYTLGQTGIGDGETGVLFDGAAGYVAVAGNPTAVTSDWSLEAWVSTTSTVAALWASNGADGSGGGGWGGGLFGGTPNPFAYYGAAAFGPAASTNYPANGLWHHVVYTNTSGTWSIYLDGTFSTSSNPGTTLAPAGGTGIACQPRTSGGPYRFWPGSIAKVAIYGYALTSTQVTNHYNARTFSGGASLPAGTAAVTTQAGAPASLI